MTTFTVVNVVAKTAQGLRSAAGCCALIAAASAASGCGSSSNGDGSAGAGASVAGASASPGGSSSVGSGGAGASTAGTSSGGASAAGATGISKGGASAGGATSGGVGGSPTAAGGASNTGGKAGAGNNSGGAGAPGTAGAGGATASQSAGCGMDPPTDSGSIDVGGQSATYLLSVPKDYDKTKPYPIVFAFHGAGVEPNIFVTYFNMPTVAGAKAIVVTPQCLGDAAAWSESRDLPMFDALLSKMQSQYCIDNKRIFAAGHSSGGMFTHMLGCRRGNILRGIGPLSSPAPTGTCVGDVAVWMSQGISDPTVTVDQGRGARDFWVKRNHCDGTASTPVDPAPTVEYGGCDAGFSVRYCEYDGDHNLPSYAPKGIWDFFSTL